MPKFLFISFSIYNFIMKKFVFLVVFMPLLFVGISQQPPAPSEPVYATAAKSSEEIEMPIPVSHSKVQTHVGEIYEIYHNDVEEINGGEKPEMNIEIQERYNNVVYIGSETSSFPIYFHSYREENGDYILEIKIRQSGGDFTAQVVVPISSVYGGISKLR